MLNDMSLSEKYSIDNVPLISPRVAKLYANTNIRTITRDVEDLLALELIAADEEKQFYANINILKSNYFAQPLLSL